MTVAFQLAAAGLANSNALSAVSSAIMTLGWIVYPQIFFYQPHRNRRPVILISRSAGRGQGARLFLSNMGAEPIYISNLIADIETEGATAEAVIDNDDIRGDECADPTEATNEGPLGSGEYLDEGSYGGLMSRSATHSTPKVNEEDVTRITLTVAALTGHLIQIAGARRGFAVVRKNGETVSHPGSFRKIQLRGLSTAAACANGSSSRITMRSAERAALHQPQALRRLRPRASGRRSPGPSHNG